MKVGHTPPLQPKVVTDLDEEEIKRRMELLGLNEDNSDDSGSEQEDDDGLVAPKGLDQEADASEAIRGKRPVEAADSD